MSAILPAFDLIVGKFGYCRIEEWEHQNERWHCEAPRHGDNLISATAVILVSEQEDVTIMPACKDCLNYFINDIALDNTWNLTTAYQKCYIGKTTPINPA